MSATIRCIDCQGPAERRNIHGWQCRQCFEANALPDTSAPDISRATKFFLDNLAGSAFDEGDWRRDESDEPFSALRMRSDDDYKALQQFIADLESRLSAATRDALDIAPIDWARTWWNILKGLLVAAAGLLVGWWVHKVQGLLRAKRLLAETKLDLEALTTKYTTLYEAHSGAAKDLPRQLQAAHDRGFVAGNAWAADVVTTHRKESVAVLLERLANNGENLEEKREREHKERVEAEFSERKSELMKLLDIANADESEAGEVAERFLNKVSKEIEGDRARTELLAVVTAWLVEKESRRKRAIQQAADEAAREKRQDDDRRRRESYSSYSSRSSSSGSTFGGGGGFSGGGGGRSF